MPFSQEAGYTPTSIATIMGAIMAKINTLWGTTYTVETFEGTNFYKYYYALAQRMQENEISTSEIFAKLTEYIELTNERISRPVVTNPGLIEKFEAEGFVASVKKIVEADAGKVYVCVDTNDGTRATGTVTITAYSNLESGTDDTLNVAGTVFTAQLGAATLGTATFRAATSNAATATSLAAQINAHATAGSKVRATALGAVVTIESKLGGTVGNAYVLTYTNNDANVGLTVSGATLTGGVTNADYAAAKLAINTIIKDSTAAGTVTVGDEVSTIVLSNGQAFDFKFNLPNRIIVLLRLTITLSENNQFVVASPATSREVLFANIAERYKLGKNFEPQKYFDIDDAPWASSVLLEWSSDNGASYQSTLFDAAYDEVFKVLLGNITIVEA